MRHVPSVGEDYGIGISEKERKKKRRKCLEAVACHPRTSSVGRTIDSRVHTRVYASETAFSACVQTRAHDAILL